MNFKKTNRGGVVCSSSPSRMRGSMAVGWKNSFLSKPGCHAPVKNAKWWAALAFFMVLAILTHLWLSYE